MSNASSSEGELISAIRANANELAPSPNGMLNRPSITKETIVTSRLETIVPSGTKG
jgi:hypothetical protein